MVSETQTKQRTIRNLAIFAIIVLACGWVGYALDRLLENPPDQQLGMLLWIVSPLIAALILRGTAGDGWKDFGLGLAIQGNIKWYAASLLIYPVIGVVILGIGSVLGIVTFPNPSPIQIITAIAVGFIGAFFKNIFEEFAWRGYLAPRIKTLGLNDYVAHAIVGAIWGAWHIPYLLLFLSPAQIQSAAAQDVTTLVLFVIPSLICASVAYNEIRWLTGSVWTAVLMHSVGNAVNEMLLAQGFVHMPMGMGILFAPGNQSILSAILFLWIGIWLRRQRLKQQV